MRDNGGEDRNAGMDPIDGDTQTPRKQGQQPGQQQELPSPMGVGLFELGHECFDEGASICLAEHSICLLGVCQCEMDYVQAGTGLCIVRAKSE